MSEFEGPPDTAPPAGPASIEIGGATLVYHPQRPDDARPSLLGNSAERPAGDVAPDPPPRAQGLLEQPLTRRRFVAASAVTGFGALLSPAARAADRPAGLPGLQSGVVRVALTVNGEPRALRVEPRVSLLDALREQLGLTGSRPGCNQGACGACTVHVNGRRVVACLSLAVMHAGDDVTTIEGLADGERLHPMQAAFIAHDGFQCGYCTSGQIMSAVKLVEEGHADSAGEIREWMSGNLCRCAAYPNIVAAIQSVSKGAT